MLPDQSEDAAGGSLVGFAATCQLLFNQPVSLAAML